MEGGLAGFGAVFFAMDGLVPCEAVVLIGIDAEAAPEGLEGAGFIAASGVDFGEIDEEWAGFGVGADVIGEDALGVFEALDVEIDDAEEDGAAFFVGIDFYEVLGGLDHLLEEFVAEGLDDEVAEAVGVIPIFLEGAAKDFFLPVFAGDVHLASVGIEYADEVGIF